MKKLGRKQRRAAAKAPRWVRDIAAAHFDPSGNRRHREAKLGTFGAASEVRHIDPNSLPLPTQAANTAGTDSSPVSAGKLHDAAQ